MTPSLLEKARSRRIAVLDRLGIQDMPDLDNMFSLETACRQRQSAAELPFVSRRGTAKGLFGAGKQIAA